MARRDSDDDAPWLAEARPRGETRVTRRSLFWTLAILLALAAVAAVGLIILLSKKDGGSTQGYMEAGQAPLITAEPGPYKVPPADPKGLEVEGQDQTLYAAGEGIDAGSVIDQSAMPEQPIPRPGSEPAAPASAPPPGPPRNLVPEAQRDAPPAATTPPPLVTPPPRVLAPAARPAPPKPAAMAPAPALPPTLPKPEPARPEPVRPEPKPVAKSGTVQLGAFSSEAAANAAWAQLAAKHGLGGKRIIAVDAGGKTLYRLRAGTADAAATCARMKAAGDACAAVE